MGGESSEDEDERYDQQSLRYRGTRFRDLDFLQKYAKRDGVVIRPSGLNYKVLSSGPKEGRRPSKSMPCFVHYKGMLTDGTEFDNTYKKGDPPLMKPGEGVEGWREALQLMREGDRWEVVIPAHLGYGERGAGPIPSGAVLIFEVEMLEVDVKDDVLGEIPGLWICKAVATIILTIILFMFFQRMMHGKPPVQGPFINADVASDADNPRVFLDIEIGGEAAGRLEFELFANIAPTTAENFRALATGEKGAGELGKALHFKGSEFHRIIPGFMCQGGDFTSGDGRGGESIYGKTFADEWETGVVQHTEPGLLSMANRGRNTNNSQFFVTVAATPWLDGRHVVFGRLTKGMETLKRMEAVGDKTGALSTSVAIVDSGELPPLQADGDDDGRPTKRPKGYSETEL